MAEGSKNSVSKKSERIDHIPEISAKVYEASYRVGWLAKARSMNPNFLETPKSKRGRKPKSACAY